MQKQLVSYKSIFKANCNDKDISEISCLKSWKTNDVGLLQYFIVSFICNDTSIIYLSPIQEQHHLGETAFTVIIRYFSLNSIPKGSDIGYVVGSVILIKERGGQSVGRFLNIFLLISPLLKLLA